MNLKTEATSKSTAIIPLVASQISQNSTVDNMLLLLGIISTLISITYTIISTITAIKEKKFNKAYAVKMIEEIRMEKEKWKNQN